MRVFVAPVLALFCVFEATVGQKCGVPKAFDTMALSQQFKKNVGLQPQRRFGLSARSTEKFEDSFRKPIINLEGSTLNLRDQEVHPPWENDKGTSQVNRIVGGYDIIDKTGGQLCWQIGLFIGFFRGFFNCGGTIVGSRTVITAAHCVVSWRGGVRSPSEFTVVAGALGGAFNGSKASGFGAPGGRSFKVKKVIMHDKYNPSSSNNDIAILILEDEMDFSQPCMCAACLDTKEPRVGEFCVTSGYGNENEGGSANRDPIPLRWVYLQVLNNRSPTCSLNSGTTTDLFICAGNVVGQDSCQGDSGGPLVCWDPDTSSYYHAGVVSFGDGCARGIGGQYTKVARYNNWIADNSEGNIRRL